MRDTVSSVCLYFEALFPVIESRFGQEYKVFLVKIDISNSI